jgi:hypothetical protein
MAERYVVWLRKQPGWGRFEWCEGAWYCWEYWLQVYQRERLPDCRRVVRRRCLEE